MAPSVTFLGAWHGDTLVGCGAVRADAGRGRDRRPALRRDQAHVRVAGAARRAHRRSGCSTRSRRPARARRRSRAARDRPDAWRAALQALRALRLRAARRVRRLSGQRARPCSWRSDGRPALSLAGHRLRAVRPARTLRARRRAARRDVEAAAGRGPSRSLRDRDGRGAARRDAVGDPHQRGLSPPEGSARARRLPVRAARRRHRRREQHRDARRLPDAADGMARRARPTRRRWTRSTRCPTRSSRSRSATLAVAAGADRRAPPRSTGAPSPAPCAG